MTSLLPTFDDSQPTLTTITLPVILPAQSRRALKETVKQTLDHLGLLQYQDFLQTLEDHWPDHVDSVWAQSDGLGMLEILFRYDEEHANSPQAHDRDTSWRWIVKHFEIAPLSSFFKFLKAPGSDEERWMTRQELPGLLESVLNARTRARVQSVTLEASLPPTNAQSPPHRL